MSRRHWAFAITSFQVVMRGTIYSFSLLESLPDYIIEPWKAMTLQTNRGDCSEAFQSRRKTKAVR